MGPRRTAFGSGFAPAPPFPSTETAARTLRSQSGFTLLETLVATAIVAIGFLGSLATVSQAGRLASAAEEDALASSALDQRMDQLRLLEWDEITSTAGVTTNIWIARPSAMAGITVAQETIAISAYDVVGAKILDGTWDDGSGPAATLGGGGPDLSTAGAVKIVATITWAGRRWGRQQTRAIVSVISRGGISKSDLP